MLPAGSGTETHVTHNYVVGALPLLHRVVANPDGFSAHSNTSTRRCLAGDGAVRFRYVQLFLQINPPGNIKNNGSRTFRGTRCPKTARDRLLGFRIIILEVRHSDDPAATTASGICTEPLRARKRRDRIFPFRQASLLVCHIPYPEIAIPEVGPFHLAKPDEAVAMGFTALFAPVGPVDHLFVIHPQPDVTALFGERDGVDLLRFCGNTLQPFLYQVESRILAQVRLSTIRVVSRIGVVGGVIAPEGALRVALEMAAPFREVVGKYVSTVLRRRCEKDDAETRVSLKILRLPLGDEILRESFRAPEHVVHFLIR